MHSRAPGPTRGYPVHTRPSAPSTIRVAPTGRLARPAPARRPSPRRRNTTPTACVWHCLAAWPNSAKGVQMLEKTRLRDHHHPIERRHRAADPHGEVGKPAEGLRAEYRSLQGFTSRAVNLIWLYCVCLTFNPIRCRWWLHTTRPDRCPPIRPAYGLHRTCV